MILFSDDYYKEIVNYYTFFRETILFIQIVFLIIQLNIFFKNIMKKIYSIFEKIKTVFFW